MQCRAGETRAISTQGIGARASSAARHSAGAAGARRQSTITASCRAVSTVATDSSATRTTVSSATQGRSACTKSSCGRPSMTPIVAKTNSPGSVPAITHRFSYDVPTQPDFSLTQMRPRSNPSCRSMPDTTAAAAATSPRAPPRTERLRSAAPKPVVMR